MTTWLGRPATEIAEAVRAGEVTALAVVEEHLGHIRRTEPRVGAFEVVDEEGARTAARLVDERVDRSSLPLAGVPVGIKDNADVAGLPSRHGSAGSSDRPATADSELVARLRRAGAVVVGKTRMPELALATVGDNAFGVARNPWNLSRVSGGSSSGSAAALSSGQVPLALGSDGGGSIRLPSAACGTLGLKPGSGTLPPRAEDPRAAWCGLSQYGPMATTVADLALMLEVLAGSGARRLPATNGLKVAASSSPTTFSRFVVDGPLLAAWQRATGTLERLGAHVRDATPPYPAFLARALATRGFIGAQYDVEHAEIDRRHIGPRTRTVLRLARVAGQLAPPRDDEANEWKRAADEFFAVHDVLVTPAAGMTAFPHRDWHAKGFVRLTPAMARFAAFTGPWNLADLPAAAVPMGLAPDGLPIAVQVVAGRGREDLVLAVAALLEREHPWPRHAPGWLSELADSRR